MAERGSAGISVPVTQRQRLGGKRETELVGDEQCLPQPIRGARAPERGGGMFTPGVVA